MKWKKSTPILSLLLVTASLIFAIFLLIQFKNMQSQHDKNDQTQIPETGQQTPPRRYTVAERMEQYSPIVHSRLLPYFEKSGIPYPPRKLLFLALKAEHRIEVWASSDGKNFIHIRDYDILAASGKAGPKLCEGDRQVPEGFYKIESLNPNSLFHLSLRVNYPNAFDLARAREEKRNSPGSDIMIHGGASSIGCLAVGDPAAEDFFFLAADIGLHNIELLIAPHDFRTKPLPPESPDLPAWIFPVYEQLTERMGLFVK